VHAHHVLDGQGQKAVGIGGAQVGLGGEGDAPQIVERAYRVGVQAMFPEKPAVEPGARGLPQGAAQPFDLGLLDVLTGPCFGFVVMHKNSLDMR
jgi:hypothetical protein